ncbi:hypothetical protein MKW94_002467 [Papaver nudicaule]|uniref:Ribulose bisphosphate carboxylase small chain n=1 Tax=Papaver nudicaule TaxID=74823 RepID=A0AA41W2A6_PAPNU|nr:hypothetical protein [Papaver nudicaule]
MASSMISCAAAVASVRRSSTPAQASMVAPFSGLKSVAAFPVTRKSNDITYVASTTLPPLTTEQLAKEVDYLLKNNWAPCLEFDARGFVYREHNSSPGYYDGRYFRPRHAEVTDVDNVALGLLIEPGQR